MLEEMVRLSFPDLSESEARAVRIEADETSFDLLPRAEQSRAAANLVRYLRITRQVDTWPARAERVAQPKLLDGRWDLVARLDRRWGEERLAAQKLELASTLDVSPDEVPLSSGDRYWSPLTIDSVEEIAFSPATAPRVVISFDGRLSRDAVKRELDAVWPELRRRSAVRATHPLGPRALALIEFVCLESDRGSTWQSRWEAWISAYPRWVVTSPRAFHAKFKRAARSLTGEANGLQWFYEDLFSSPPPPHVRKRLASELSFASREDVGPTARDVLHRAAQENVTLDFAERVAAPHFASVRARQWAEGLSDEELESLASRGLSRADAETVRRDVLLGEFQERIDKKRAEQTGAADEQAR